jgi:hypothetical protein
MRLLPIALAILVGCAPETTVELSGKIAVDRSLEAEPFADASLKVFDKEGALVDKTTCNGNGHFSTLVPAGNHGFLIVDGEGSVPSSFTGICGPFEPCEAELGTMWGFSQEEYDEWQVKFAGCPGAGEGTMVLGEARVQELIDPDSGEHPTVNAAVAELWEESTGNTWPACYLDEDGAAYDPDAVATGASGMFAIFGAPKGLLVLSVGLEVGPGSWTWDDSFVHTVEDGVVARFPAWVHFPL